MSPINNLLGFRMHDQIQRHGAEVETKESSWCSRVFSLNELDLLARLLHFDMVATFGAMDIAQPISDPQSVTPVEFRPGSYVVVLKK